MTELNIGVALKETYNFLSEIFSDTSKLLSIVEDHMKNNGFRSFWGTTAFWDTSQAYSGDSGWLCHYLSRIYLPKKPNINGKFRMFINVYFVPKQVEQPIILSGIAKVSQDDFFKSWKETMCDNYGPEFVTTDFLESWEVVKIGDGSDLQELVFKIKPLIEVNNQVKTKALCDEVIHKFRDIES
jgi:hypothetical protein